MTVRELLPQVLVDNPRSNWSADAQLHSTHGKVILIDVWARVIKLGLPLLIFNLYSLVV